MISRTPLRDVQRLCRRGVGTSPPPSSSPNAGVLYSSDSSSIPLALRKFTSGEKSTFNILSLDGGGVRGAFTATVLARLEEECGPDFIDSFDLIAGTSTGAVLALCLAKGMKVSDAAEAYRTACPEIFAPRPQSLPWIQQSLGLGNLLKAKYENATLKRHLEGWLGDTTLGGLSKSVVLTAFNVHGAPSSTHTSQEHNSLRSPLASVLGLKAEAARADSKGGGGGGVEEGGQRPSAARWRPAVFSNLPPVQGVVGTDHDLLCVDAALRSTAAPTFFPVYQGYCDGAMTANNPSLVAISKALAHFPGSLHRENVRVLSLGAGSHVKSLAATSTPPPTALSVGGAVGAQPQQQGAMLDWGMVNWAPHLISLLMDSSALSTDLLVGLMIGHRQQYHRLECALVPPRGFTLALDEVASIPVLVDLANRVDLTETVAFVKEQLLANQNQNSFSEEICGGAEGDGQRQQRRRQDLAAAAAAAAAEAQGAQVTRANAQQQQQQKQFPQQKQQQQQHRNLNVAAVDEGVNFRSIISTANDTDDGVDNLNDKNSRDNNDSFADLTDLAAAAVAEKLKDDDVAGREEHKHSSPSKHIDFGGSSLEMRYYEQIAEVDDAWERVALATIQTKLPKEHRLSEK